MQNQGYRPAPQKAPAEPPRPHKRRERLIQKKRIFLVCSLTAVVIIVAAAVAAMTRGGNEERRAYNASRQTFLDGIYVDGISLGGLTYNEAWDAVSKRVQEWENAWSLQIACNGFVYSTVNYAAAGIHFDYEQIDSLLQSAWAIGHTGGYEQYLSDAQRLAQEAYQGYIEPAEGSSGQIEYILQVIAENVYRAPQDAAVAAFDPANAEEPFTFTNPVYGRTIDQEAAKAEILRRAATGESGRYDIPLVSIEPEVTLADAKQNVSLLAMASTAIDRASTEIRNANIAVAFAKINGLVLENNARFSFNKTVGKRSVENGYQVALGYVSGQLVDVVGGGVCQVRTTLYSAALCAGMAITSRTPHSMPVSYISLGQDATVNDMRGHEIDLAFTNKTGGRVYITAGIEPTPSGRKQCVVRFFGQAMPDNATYKLESTIVEKLEIPEDIIKKDKDAKYVTYEDQKHKVSSGSEGYVVKTYLQYCKNGVVQSQTLISTDTYRARAAVYYVGVTPR